MANNQTSRDGACEKIFKAFRRISYPPKPATTSVLYSSGPTSSEVPIVFNHPPTTQNKVTPMRKTDQVVRFASRNEPVKQLGHGEPKKKVVDRGSSAKVDNVDDKFSEYIARAKAKIRTTSDVGGESGGYGYGSGGNGGGGGGERSGLRPDSFNDRVNNYINRAKLKIRATSNVGARRSVSIK